MDGGSLGYPYNVLRSTTGPSGTFSSITNGVSGTSYFDAGGVLGDYYKVVTVGPGGSSLASSAADSVPLLLNVNFDSGGGGPGNFGGGEKPVPTAASGPGVIGSPGDIWNGVNGGGAPNFTSGSLVNSDGSTSSATVSFVSTGKVAHFVKNAPSFPTFSKFAWASSANMINGIGYPNSPYAVLMSTIINVTPGPTGPDAYVTISNLTPNANYTLFVYSAGNAAGRVSSFWINNGPTNNCTYDNSTITLVSGVDYLQFSTSADVNGNITINFGNTLGENDLNGFQLIAGSVAPAAITPSASLNGLTLCTNTSLTFTATSGSVGGLPSTTISAFTNVVATSALGSLPRRPPLPMCIRRTARSPA